MKHLFIIQLLSYVLFAHAAQATLSEACSGLKDLSSCKFKFSVPTGFTVKTKEVSEKKLNKCKTKKKETKPCPTKKEPSKTCNTMTCVSGYDIIKKRVPTGVKVTTKQVDLCETVRKVLGQPQGDIFIKSSDAICKCFPRLRQLNTTAQFNSLSQGIMSPSNGKVADEFLSLNTCLQNGGIDLEDNWNEVKGSIQSGPGFPTSQVFDMDETTYPKLIAGIKSCQQGACNSTLITETIRNVLRASSEADGSLRGSLNRWKAMLSSMRSVSTDLNDLLPKFMLYVDSAQVLLDEINDVCTELGGCQGPHVAEFLQKVDGNIAATKYLGTLRLPSSLVRTLDHSLKRVQEALNQPRYLDDDDVVALFKNNKMETTKDLFQLLPKIKTLVPISKDINTRLVPMKEFLPNNQTFAISTYTEQLLLLSIPVQDIKQELGENHDLIYRLSTMRELIAKNSDQFYLGRLISYLGSLMGQFNGLSEMVGKFTIETKVVNYKAWSKLPAIAMPCSRQKTKTYKDSGFKEVFSYPEYFKCMVDEATAAFPGRQMGFVRIT